jgi:glucose/arabinose dehydrogenase
MRPRLAPLVRALLALGLLPLTALGQNHPPQQPTVIEPEQDGQIVDPADVHMRSGPFSDPDAGDQHACTDWQLYTVTPSERVWTITCGTGVELLAAQLGDGTFEGSHAGRTDLLPNKNYQLRVRHSDDSGDPATQWSPWGTRDFRTGDSIEIFPLELNDVADAPAPSLTRAFDGSELILPGGAQPPVLRVQTADGDLLLIVAGVDGTQNSVTNPAPIPTGEPVKVRLYAGSSGISFPEADLAVHDEGCAEHVLLLPGVQLAPGQDAYWWIDSTGSSYAATATGTTPSFTNRLRGLSPPWHLRQPGYEIEVFAEGFELPVNIAFVPNPGPDPDDPFFYVTELYGQIRTVRRDGSVGDYATGLLNFNPTGSFPGSGEQGVTGIVVDPLNGDVYASMLYASAATPSIHYPKVVRFTSQDGGQTAATQTTILDMVGESQGQSHQISHLSFGPDGKLYVHMGDGFNSGTAQNLSSFRGKILRIERSGAPATDNPFYDPTDGINAADHVYAYGLRNPFGGAWRELDGMHYEVENGPFVDRFAQIVEGRNYLWDGSNQSMGNFALYNWNPSHGPVNLVFVQPGLFGGSGFPPAKMDHAFVTESGPTYATGPQERGKYVTEWILDGNGDLMMGPIPFMEYAGMGQATAVGLAAGPDGLYMTELYKDDGSTATQPGARVLRISYDPSFDCNGNGVSDDCDIAAGTSLDVDGNGVPDECDCAGVPFCQATPSSAGAPAALSSNGECAVADNALVLSAAPVPNQPGIFFYGANQVNGGAGLPFLDGFRCVGGGAPVFRLPPITASGNVATLAVDLTSPPPGGGQITSGSTWHFQYWFRDPAAGGAGANLSNALTIVFQ